MMLQQFYYILLVHKYKYETIKLMSHLRFCRASLTRDKIAGHRIEQRCIRKTSRATVRLATTQRATRPVILETDARPLSRVKVARLRRRCDIGLSDVNLPIKVVDLLTDLQPTVTFLS